MTPDLVSWLRAQLDHVEQVARRALAELEAYGGTWTGFADALWKRTTVDADAICDVIDAHGPAAVLRQVAAHRAILDLHEITTELERWDSAAVDGSHLPGDLTGRPVHWCAVCDVDPRSGERYAGTDPACPTLLSIAAIYQDRPGWDPSWTVEG